MKLAQFDIACALSICIKYTCSPCIVNFVRADKYRRQSSMYCVVQDLMLASSFASTSLQFRVSFIAISCCLLQKFQCLMAVKFTTVLCSFGERWSQFFKTKCLVSFQSNFVGSVMNCMYKTNCRLCLGWSLILVFAKNCYHGTISLFYNRETW